MDDELLKALKEVNDEYFGAVIGGRTRFFQDERPLIPMLKETFKDVLAPRTVTIANGENGLKIVGVYERWMKWGGRRFYKRGLTLNPDEPGHTCDQYNLWQGFAVEPRPGDWSLMRRHIHEVLASGVEEHADYIIKWTAMLLQRPLELPRVALVFRGDEGVGKGVFANSLVHLLAGHAMRVQTMGQFTGRFNAHLRDKVLLFADEAVVPSTAEEGALKGLISEGDVPIEGKGIDVELGRNYLHVIMATNKEYVVPAGKNARRFAVFDVSDARQRDHAYFKALLDQMQHGGHSAMLHDLREMDLRGWHPEAARPDTDALSDQKRLSMPPVQALVQSLLESGEVPHAHKRKGKEVFVATRLLLETDRRLEPRDQTALGRELRAAAGRRTSDRQSLDDIQYRGYWLPALSKARQLWEAHLGRSVPWPDDVVDWNDDE